MTRQTLGATMSAFAAIALAVAIEQHSIASINGWWADELFALWASDPSVGLIELFLTRIATDSNPPLYFSLLHLTRLFIAHDRVAVVVLNLMIMAVGITTALAIAWRSRFRFPILVSCAVFLLSGPVAAYLPEARAYLLAMTVSFIAVVGTALAVAEEGDHVNGKAFAVVGFLAGLSHVFAALLCCALALALFLVNFISERPRSLVRSLPLASSAVAGSLLWILIWSRLGPGNLGQVSWIPFNKSFVWHSGLDALSLTYGTAWLAIACLAVIAISLTSPSSRRVAGLVAISISLYVGVPVIISFWVPIILARYWLVGSPLFLAVLPIVLACWSNARGRLRSVRVAAGLLIAASLPLGFRAAEAFVAAKPIWRGVAVVSPRLTGCKKDSIHVLGFVPGFAIVTGAAPDTFVDVRALPDEISPVGKDCALLGWSEHFVLRFGMDYMSRATDADLLTLLKLDVAPNDVDIDRSRSGFVVRWRGR